MSRNEKKLALVAGFLKGQSTLSLATVNPDGTPAVAPLFYLSDDALRLYWFSSRASVHSRNLKKNPEAAVTVYRDTAQWKEICGVQLRGTVHLVADRNQRRALAGAYAERFHLEKVFAAVMARSGLYVFEPSWLRYLDNSRRFGYQFEVRLASAEPV